MSLWKSFCQDRRGVILQFFISMVIMGALSYAFWNIWEHRMSEAGTSLKARIETDAWLSE